MGCVGSHVAKPKADPFGLPMNAQLPEEQQQLAAAERSCSPPPAPPYQPVEAAAAARAEEAADAPDSLESLRLRGTLHPPTDWRELDTDTTTSRSHLSTNQLRSPGLRDIAQSLAAARPARAPLGDRANTAPTAGSRRSRSHLFTPTNSPKNMTNEERERYRLNKAVAKLTQPQQQRLYDFLSVKFRHALATGQGRVEFRPVRLQLDEVRQVFVYVAEITRADATATATNDTPTRHSERVGGGGGGGEQLVPLDTLPEHILNGVHAYLAERFPKCLVTTKLGLAIDPAKLRPAESKEVQGFLLRLNEVYRVSST